MMVVLLFSQIGGLWAQTQEHTQKHSHEDIHGSVRDVEGNPIIGAEVVWYGTSLGAITDADGNFVVSFTHESQFLIVSYLSYRSDTIEVAVAPRPIEVTLYDSSAELDEVEVMGRGATTMASRISAVQTSTITGAELCRAACCNLSESFETNASVDVSYADAATGAKQIKLLGLSGTYVQMLNENTPSVRGLAQNFGMEYTPGVWMESIQVSKGTSSVINGYEATTGQINVEYLKPQTQDPIAINAMMNSNLRSELNVTGGWGINEVVSTGVMAHAKLARMEHDTNDDGFMDLPKEKQVNLLNRWYIKSGDYTGQILVRGLYDERNGGQLSSYGDDRYKIDLETYRFDAFMKNGYVFDKDKGTSIGVIMSGSYHKQDNLYGVRDYVADQTNIYGNAIFQTNFTDYHKLVTGVSLNYDAYNEMLITESASFDMDREELTSGLFAEYSYTIDEKLSLLAGARVDYSSLWGVFATPRFNVRYAPWEWVNLRGSVGLGYRSPNLLSDYASVLPSSREIIVAEDLKQERAINTGVSSTFYIPIAGRELQITADYYYTSFFETVVMDMDRDPNSVTFSNSNGERSYAANFQVEATMEILSGWTTTLAYRISDTKATINGELREKPLTNRFKALVTTSYVTPLFRWQFDLTAQINGGGRMPDADENNPLWDNEFGWYPRLMAQVTRNIGNWSIYVGGENLTNFTQSNPIIGADNPFGANFDASMAWGPLHGAAVYAGFRWNIGRDE